MSSASPNFTLSEGGKKVLLVRQIHELTATVYLERVKLRMIQKKALTSGDKQFGILHAQQRGRLNVLEAELAHYVETFESLNSKTPAQESY